MDEGKLWSLIRNVIAQGAAIQIDYANRGYEEFSARIDAAAAERVADFTKLADAQITELQQSVARLETELELARRMLDEAATDPAGQYYFGLRCGVEDRDIQDRYEAAEYGWQQAFEYVGSFAGNEARAGNGGGA